jgi:hypothetical protein
MGSDFSALDAELDTVGVGAASVDVLSLAVSYSGNLTALSDIDAALGALDADGVELHQRVAASAIVEVPSFVASSSGELVSGEHATSLGGSRSLESEEIVLPDPLPRTRAEQREAADKSGELSLDTGTPRSGSFSLDGDGILPGNRNDPLETPEEELADADVDLLELRPESAPMTGMAKEHSAAPLFDAAGRVGRAEAESTDRGESDAVFAELFAEAGRQQSAAPAPRHSQPPPAYDDTEIFDSGSVGYVENLEQSAVIAETVGAEELDSAEFEIVMDDDTRVSPPSVPPVHPSQPPEKRPSFLGRLFGRKEES